MEKILSVLQIAFVATCMVFAEPMVLQNPAQAATVTVATFEDLDRIAVRLRGDDGAGAFDKYVYAEGFRALNSFNEQLFIALCFEGGDFRKIGEYTIVPFSGLLASQVKTIFNAASGKWGIAQIEMWRKLLGYDVDVGGPVVEAQVTLFTAGLVDPEDESAVAYFLVPTDPTAQMLITVPDSRFFGAGDPVSAPSTLGLAVAGMVSIAIVRRRRPAEEQVLAA